MGFARIWLAAVALAAALQTTAVPAQAPSAAKVSTVATPSATNTEAKPERIPAAAFASNNDFADAKLSPDGTKIALRKTYNEVAILLVLETATKKAVSLIESSADTQLEWFRWAGNGKLLLSLSSVGDFYGIEMRFTRLHVFDIAKKSFTYIGRKSEGFVGDNVLYLDPAGDFALLALQSSIFDWPAVWRFPLDETAQKAAVQVQRSREGVFGWFADDDGAVRMGMGWGGSKLKVWYRSTPDADFKVIAKIGEDNLEESIWDVARIIGGSDEGYVLENAGDRIALRKFNYATRTAGDVVYQNPAWDVTEFDVDDDGKPIAAYYTDDKERVEWLDSKRKSLHERLERAMPDMDVWVTSRAKDDSRMLVHVGREDDPGALYVYTAAEKSLVHFANYRPALQASLLARPKAISYEARDKTSLRGYLTLPRGRAPRDLPLIILPHGGPYGVRDALTYSNEVQFLANRGYAVLQPNFRGSGGFGEAFEKIGDGQIGRSMQDDLDDGMDWLVKQGIADAKRVCIVGTSYGGYAGLWGVIRNPERYRCAASFAGVTDWKKQLSYSNRGVDKDDRRDWTKKVKGEVKDFDLDTISPVKQVARLTRPVLLAHGDKDSRVPFSEFKLLRDAAKKANAPVEPLVFKDEGHGFAKPENEQKWYEALEAFLTKNNPAD